MKKCVAIAIDGPAAAGKSTVAKLVAKALNMTYIDTGAMYRAVTWATINAGLDPKKEEDAKTLLPGLKIDLMEDGRVFCNGNDVTKIIREPIVSGNVSYIAAMKSVRLALIDMQRELAKSKSVVMDGRDIGSYVLPDAEVKIFQIASVETRAQRRFIENQSKGIDTTYEEVEEEVRKRDYIDSHRDFDPLVAAEDSIEIDTSFMTIQEVVDAILKVIKEKTGLEPQCH
ncbi:MAG: (d)CMP kinase [Bacilli bacterium]|nr:(d)CMP kinase [Bacilli bacterium]